MTQKKKTDKAKKEFKKSLKEYEEAKSLQTALQNGEISALVYLKALTDIQRQRIINGEL